MARVILVSGTGRGFMPAIARHFAEQGAIVALHGEPAATAALAAELARDGHQAFAAAAEALDPAAAQRLVDEVYREAGRLDALVTVADPPDDAPLLGIGQAAWLAAFDRDVHGAFYVMQAAARYMLLDRRGRIVAVTAEPGAYPQRAQSASAAAMGALHALVRALAVELAPKQIGVNAVVPGPARVEPLAPLQQPTTARDVAELVCFLASEEASYVTGERYHVDGGLAGHR